MPRDTIVAAGGIVIQRGETPLIALVCLRKSNEWVLPKGKLAKGETSRAAAEREVLEETGHEVRVHEFLGTLAYAAVGGRSKVVHFWRMEATDAPSRQLLTDVTAVAWLPLPEAGRRLSRDYERVFLAEVGPLALASATAAPARAEPSIPVPTQPAPGLLRRLWRWLCG